MPDRISLRPFCPDDIPTPFALFRGTVHRVNGRDNSPEQVAAWAPEEIDAARWAILSERFVVVAEVVGRSRDSPTWSRTGHIDRFFVHADHQGRGVGTAMMQAIVDEAERVEMGRHFAEASITARLLFVRHGFEVLAEQRVVVRGVSLSNFRMQRLLQ